MLKSLLIQGILLMFTTAAFSQVDSAVTQSSIKGLTLKQYSDIEHGPDLADKALVATLNKYPMPDDVLKLTKELKLTKIQITAIAEVSRYLRQKKLQTGQSVLLNEKKLDDLFRTNKVNDGNIAFYANRYGLYEGEYRTSVLLACFNTYKALTPQQIALFEQLKSR